MTDEEQIIKAKWLVDMYGHIIKGGHHAKFDFLKVDEKLDREIDRYLATYKGSDREILDI